MQRIALKEAKRKEKEMKRKEKEISNRITEDEPEGYVENTKKLSRSLSSKRDKTRNEVKN